MVWFFRSSWHQEFKINREFYLDIMLGFKGRKRKCMVYSWNNKKLVMVSLPSYAMISNTMNDGDTNFDFTKLFEPRLAIHKPMLAELNDTFGPSSYWGIALVQQYCYSLRWYQTCYSLTHTTILCLAGSPLGFWRHGICKVSNSSFLICSFIFS